MTALYIGCGVYLVTVVLFYVRGRYRIPAVPFLMVFAAVAVERGLHAMAARRWRAVVAPGLGLVVAGTITNHERCEASHDGIPAVCLGVDSWFDSEWLKPLAVVSGQWRPRPGRALRRAGLRVYAAPKCGHGRAWIAGVEARWTLEP